MRRQGDLASLLLLVGLAVCCSVSGATSEIGTLAFEDAAYAVRLVQRESLSTFAERYSFAVRDKQTGRETTLTSTSTLKEIGSLRRVGGRLLLFGRDQFSQGLAILGLDKGRQVDYIIGSAISASKAGSYVVFKKFRPRLDPIETQSDVVLIYDLGQSPADNRVEALYKRLVQQPMDPTSLDYAEASERAGLPIYPADNVRSRTIEAWEPISELRHQVADHFVWLGRDTLVGFVDKHADEVWLVAVDLSGGVTQPRERARKIDVAAVLAIRPDAPEYERELKAAKTAFWVAALWERPDGKIGIRAEVSSRLYEFAVEVPR
jgi:hypothetical protein